MKIKNLLRGLLFSLSIAFIALIVVFLVKNRSLFQNSVDINLTRTGVDVIIQNLHLIEEEEGKKHWELDADRAEIINSKEITRLSKVRVNFFQENGDQILVTANSGVIQNNTRDIELKGNIIISNYDGYVLKAESLNWITEIKTIQTDDKVGISGKNISISGKGMTVNMETEVVEIYGGVKLLYSEIKTSPE